MLGIMNIKSRLITNFFIILYIFPSCVCLCQDFEFDCSLLSNLYSWRCFNELSTSFLYKNKSFSFKISQEITKFIDKEELCKIIGTLVNEKQDDSFIYIDNNNNSEKLNSKYYKNKVRLLIEENKIFLLFENKKIFIMEKVKQRKYDLEPDLLLHLRQGSNLSFKEIELEIVNLTNTDIVSNPSFCLQFSPGNCNYPLYYLAVSKEYSIKDFLDTELPSANKIKIPAKNSLKFKIPLAKLRYLQPYNANVSPESAGEKLKKLLEPGKYRAFVEISLCCDTRYVSYYSNLIDIIIR